MAQLLDILEAHRGNPGDTRVFGLVLQGGGMRAAYSAGAIAPLIGYGLADTFEHVIGSSAGAINGAYFIGADKNMFRTYTDDLTNKNFVNLARPGKVVDIDYLVDVVLKHKRPVDSERLRSAHSQLHTVLTDAHTGKKVVISDHNEFMEIYEEFRATAALPILYDKQVEIAGRYYIDGGVSDLVPVDVALKLGCTDIVVIMTRQVAEYTFDKRHSHLEKRLIHYFARHQTKAVQSILPTNEKRLAVNLQWLRHPGKHTRIYLLEPSDPETGVSIGSTNKSKIEALAQLGVRDMDAFLHRDLPDMA
ncbi:MAG TPA: patatin family protein [Candidatus Saccharimonadales bacterium]